MRKTAIILAGGSGTRAGGGTPKQFRTLGGEPMFHRPVSAFMAADPQTEIVLAVNPLFLSECREMVYAFPEETAKKIRIVAGGSSRAESVSNALAAIPHNEGMVAVHDAARPLVSVDMIKRGWEACGGKNCVVPAVPLTDSIRMLGGNGKSESVDRSRFVAVQTPQVFPLDLLKRAYDTADALPGFTDDASLAEAAGETITLYEGEPENIKVTTPQDFGIAEIILRERASQK